MANSHHAHTLAIGIIAIQLGAIAVLSQREADAAPVAEKPHRESASAPRTTDSATSPAPPEYKAELDRLRAAGDHLEKQIKDLRASQPPALSSGDSVRIPLEYFSAHRNWWARHPLLTVNHQLWDTLMISEDEERAIHETSDRFLAELKEIEQSLLSKETDTDGTPIFLVPASPELTAPLMARLADQLEDQLGAGRGPIIYSDLQDTVFLHGLKKSLRIGMAEVGGGLFPAGAATPHLPSVQFLHPDVSKGDPETHQIPLDPERASHFVERFGHLLGVETPQEINQLFQPQAGE